MLAGLRKKRAGLVEQRGNLLAETKNHSSEAMQLYRRGETLKSQKKHRCVWIRNQYIKQRIQADFASRQQKLTGLVENDAMVYDGSVEVFPVSGRAIKDLLKNNKPMAGFPSKPYTGIPKLRHWLSKTVLVYREEHLDSLLRGLQRLFDGIKCWSDGESGGTVHFSRHHIERLLQASHDKYLDVSATHRASGMNQAR
jgi:hypothetical protein